MNLQRDFIFLMSPSFSSVCSFKTFAYEEELDCEELLESKTIYVTHSKSGFTNQCTGDRNELTRCRITHTADAVSVHCLVTAYSCARFCGKSTY